MIRVVTLVLFFLSLATAEVAVEPKPTEGVHTSIIGGLDARNGQFPWSVYYNYTTQSKSTISCMGVIVKPAWVLTAAHCLYQRSNITINAYAGSVNLFDHRSQKRTSTKFYIHPNYNPSVSESNDIALIRLSRGYKFTTTRSAASISLIKPVKGEILATAGFGLTINGNLNSIPLRNMKYIQLPFYEADVCVAKLKSFYNDKTMFCAGGSKSPQADTCDGDSGSAMIRTRDVLNAKRMNGIVGLSSFGTVLCASGTPAGYTRVGIYYESFIRPLTGNLSIGCSRISDCPTPSDPNLRALCTSNICITAPK